ncbi:hypothetical protein FACS189421_12660 [Bacteroidia bacterium]|nr:hypothetical protein FACS189421_12660 [Bacteroidia bacterium]GHT03649.1 hypothetical protein FACS189423_05040 [Bacteroidia bacterium]
MDSIIPVIKGVHPGIILERELKLRNLKKKAFALSIHEFPQTISSITKRKRRINPALSLKIEKALGIEEGFFMVLQAYYDVEQEKLKKTKDYHPNLSKIRPYLFWDTDFNTINWAKHKSGIINRIFERGNEQEIKEIIDFYGKEEVKNVLDSNKDLILNAAINKNKYFPNNFI